MRRAGRAGADVPEGLGSEGLRHLVAIRARVSALLTSALLTIYGAYIGIAASSMSSPGLEKVEYHALGSFGTLLPLAVIGLLWLLIVLYVVWANGPYERELKRIRSRTVR